MNEEKLINLLQKMLAPLTAKHEMKREHLLEEIQFCKENLEMAEKALIEHDQLKLDFTEFFNELAGAPNVQPPMGYQYDADNNLVKTGKVVPSEGPFGAFFPKIDPDKVN